MANAGSLLVALLVLRRRPRWDGFLILVFAAWYGAGRFLEDFFRIDDTVALGLSGSQLSALTLVVVAGGWLASVRRPPGLDTAGHPEDEAEVERSGSESARKSVVWGRSGSVGVDLGG